ncbi:hypothetical protein OPT61_g7337 [Boeremia exigua]|uniref:Uncharacterized protein n=1 Tax=Boeremia exigua TaxID=749465 RepID=A0ACC2I3L9_9PLEO|nr:hypothetical protein OPT61_g7337 [Boeremia exigua]
MDPLSAGVFASIGSAFKFADVAVRIAEVGSENAVFVRAICVVRSDLEEVERLLSLVSIQLKLAGTPGKLPWIKNAIQNTRSALNEIGKWVERARVEQETTGSIKFDTRVRWVFNDHEKLLNRKTELAACHQQLSNVLGYLVSLEERTADSGSPDCEDSTYLDDILSRHRRSSRPEEPKTRLRTTPSVTGEYISRTDSTRPVASSHSPPISDAPVSPRPIDPFSNKHIGFIRPPSTTSSLSPPSSPPPAYTTAVSIGPDHLETGLSPQMHTKPKANTSTVESVDGKGAHNNFNGSTWAYRSSFDGMAVPELAGDTVSFSATNSAGPVNPYELCAYTGIVVPADARKGHGPNENLAEMLGDLHFPTELPSNSDPPTAYNSQKRTRFDQTRSTLPSYIQPKRRVTTETPHRVHRRPLPANALSDSLLTVHELTPAPPVPEKISNALDEDSYRPLTTGLASVAVHQQYTNQRPSSYSVDHSHRAMAAPAPVSNRHYSAPPPLASVRNEYAAAFSADSVSSWGLNTEPRGPKAPSVPVPTKATRMQSQRRIMDLLESIER